jgi:hypothetical protein
MKELFTASFVSCNTSITLYSFGLENIYKRMQVI